MTWLTCYVEADVVVEEDTLDTPFPIPRSRGKTTRSGKPHQHGRGLRLALEQPGAARSQTRQGDFNRGGTGPPE